MGKTRILWLAALIGVVTGGIVFLSLTPRKLVYQGKNLREWVREGYTNPPGRIDLEAADAVRFIGTNGVPALLNMVRQHDSAFKIALMKLAARQKYVQFRLEDETTIRKQGHWSIQALGPAAMSAVPALIHAMADASPAEMRTSVTDFGYIGPDAKAAIPALLRTLKTNDNIIRNNTLWSLSRIHEEPDLVIPALLEHLSDSYQTARENAWIGLGAYSNRAKIALPAIQAVLTGPAGQAQDMALFAMQQIDPLAALPYYLTRLENPEVRIRVWSAKYWATSGLRPRLRCPHCSVC